jgi:hypothetical protein
VHADSFLRPQARSTLVAFHDLLGFGDLLSASGGTLDSAAGAIAYQRIIGLRRTLEDVRPRFPATTRFFHFNDTVTAYLDIDAAIGSMHTDATGMHSSLVTREETLKAIAFLDASAALHHTSIIREERDRIGPAGRTFVVLGKRWDIEAQSAEEVSEPALLQANIAFAEAYHADRAGSSAGFSHRSYERLYVNDLLYFLLSVSGLSLFPAEKAALDKLGDKSQHGFPHNLTQPDSRPVVVSIFHRPRSFYNLMSHHAVDIRAALDSVQAQALAEPQDTTPSGQQGDSGEV